MRIRFLEIAQIELNDAIEYYNSPRNEPEGVRPDASLTELCTKSERTKSW